MNPGAMSHKMKADTPGYIWFKSIQVKQFYSELKSHNVTHEPTHLQHMYGGNNNSERNSEKNVLEKT